MRSLPHRLIKNPRFTAEYTRIRQGPASSIFSSVGLMDAHCLRINQYYHLSIFMSIPPRNDVRTRFCLGK